MVVLGSVFRATLGGYTWWALMVKQASSANQQQLVFIQACLRTGFCFFFRRLSSVPNKYLAWAWPLFRRFAIRCTRLMAFSHCVMSAKRKLVVDHLYVVCRPTCSTHMNNVAASKKRRTTVGNGSGLADVGQEDWLPRSFALGGACYTRNVHKLHGGGTDTLGLNKFRPAWSGVGSGMATTPVGLDWVQN